MTTPASSTSSSFPSLAVDRLEESLERFLAADGLSNPGPNAEIHRGYRRQRRNDVLRDCFGWVFDVFAPVHPTSWLSWIEPHGYIVPHVDAGPHRERWQVPIRTSGTMTVDGEQVVQEPGVPFQVKHWTWHEVSVGDTPRVHLVIDRDVFVSTEKTPFLK